MQIPIMQNDLDLESIQEFLRHLWAGLPVLRKFYLCIGKYQSSKIDEALKQKVRIMGIIEQKELFEVTFNVLEEKINDTKQNNVN